MNLAKARKKPWSIRILEFGDIRVVAKYKDKHKHDYEYEVLYVMNYFTNDNSKSYIKILNNIKYIVNIHNASLAKPKKKVTRK